MGWTTFGTTRVDSLSRSFNSKPVAGRGIAMLVVGDTSRTKCNYCEGVGHVNKIAPS